MHFIQEIFRKDWKKWSMLPRCTVFNFYNFFFYFSQNRIKVIRVFSNVVGNIIRRNFVEDTTYLSIDLSAYLWSFLWSALKNQFLCHNFFWRFSAIFKCSTNLFFMLKYTKLQKQPYFYLVNSLSFCKFCVWKSVFLQSCNS